MGNLRDADWLECGTLLQSIRWNHRPAQHFIVFVNAISPGR
jgi:hypothetical protein